jgi:hypothetical protein
VGLAIDFPLDQVLHLATFLIDGEAGDGASDRGRHDLAHGVALLENCSAMPATL